jgi:anti-sigma regulatory factor (Ser/Thr protein kinase)
VSSTSTSLTLSAVPESAAVARREISARIAEQDAAAAVALMVSELVTNSLLQGELGPTDTITVHAEPVEHGLRVTVCDSGAIADDRIWQEGANEVHRHGGPGGLGLKIIARLSDRWGLTSPHPGTRAWFEVDAHLL